MNHKTVLLSLTSLGLGLLTYQHLSLRSLYPSLSVPPQLSISNRSLKPYSTNHWTKCEVGDSWAVKVPESTLIRQLPLDGEDGDLGEKWNKAFWTTWPLRLEGILLGSIINMVKHRSNGENDERKEVDWSEEGHGFEMKVGQTAVNGLFTVESIDQIPFHLRSHVTSTSTSTQITYSWGNLSPPGPTEPSSWISIPIRGGYHTLSVLSESYLNSQDHSSKENEFSSRSESGDDQWVYLIFTAHGISSTSTSASTSTSSNDQPGKRGMFDKLFIEFHKTYSRILVHLAIRQMGLSNVVEKVDRWP
ncbi:hypothetical protein V865_004889 [Kwoniella europaea PYCC6329]|uniref:SUN domain-containing protein n=1 Tax=Kwoniella europaea PYCC6329 TaxID=1423913 RepID=A0AAX4KLH9_9TREE